MLEGQFELELTAQMMAEASMLSKSSFANVEEETKLMDCNMVATKFLVP